MPTSVEVSRTLVKSAPEIWAELERGRLADAVDGWVAVAEPDRELRFGARGGTRGRARLDPAPWGTRLTVTAEVGRRPPLATLVARLPGGRLVSGLMWPEGGSGDDVRTRIEALVDDLARAHRKPFMKDTASI